VSLGLKTMTATLAGDDLARSMSRRLSVASSSRRSWASASIREAFSTPGGDIFQRSGRQEDEDELKWAAIERLPTYDRLRKGMLKQVLDNGRVVHEQVDVTNLGMQDKKQLMESILKVVEDDNERFLLRLRDRTDRVGIDIPKVEIRFEHLSIEGDVYVGSRALPTLWNATLNTIEGLLQLIKLVPSKKRVVEILRDVSGIVKPSRMTLLLGPPGSGKTTLLRALAGVLDKDLRVSGNITYCGHEMSEFYPQRTCAYISQHDVHHGEMTVRETLDFSGRCLGVGTRYDLLAELSRREKDAGIKPDPEIDAFMKATAMSGQESSLVTDYVLKILGLDICADIMVGDEMRRGISGGQKKRVTTGEMLVGPAKVFFMDEISTGLDSSTTFQIVKYMRQMVHIMDVTMIISLLQPAPETFDLFDDIIVLSEGQIVYQGPRENILEFFESVGFKCPDRKGVADFLQEVTSKKDQEQYWFKKNEPYQYVSVPELARRFSSFHIGQKVFDELGIPYDRSQVHPAALVKEKYGISNMELFKASLSREWLLMKRNSFLYIFKTTQITIMSIIAFTVFFRTKMKSGQLEDGAKFYGALFFGLLNVMFNGAAELALTIFRLPVFFKQRDSLFYPAWAFALPIWLMRIPISLMESLIWIVLTYYTIGFAPAANDIQSWMIWGYYISPMMYGQNAIVINEFLDERWSTPNPDPRISEPTVGKVLLKSRGMFVDDYMFWICVIALFGFSLLFNVCFIIALTYLNPLGDSRTVIVDEDENNKKKRPAATDRSSASTAPMFEGISLCGNVSCLMAYDVSLIILQEMKSQGIEETRLQLLRDVSGAFRPGVLTALVGVSGAGKTTLMDVLAGRKTGGYIEGSISISGYPKKQETFARVSGYCEQNDIHSPHVTVYESLVYSAWLRLAPDVKKQTRQMFVEEVMDLVELNPLRDALVGLPGVDGLSTEQRKRLTIAVELVANPSIIFMDEPTSGLDARAAAIVMRTVRNTVDTGRTVVCTIHQPSIDIFEAFDELLLMKRGGQVIYAGPLGHHSHLLVEYFESIPGVPKIREGFNPATWMLEVSSAGVEAQLDVDFADIYANSDLYRRNQELIRELSSPAPGSQDLYFPTTYAQPFFTQCKACFWKMHWSYWRHPQYNAIRFFMTTVIGLLFGVIFWNKGEKLGQQQDLMNLLGAMYSAVMFLGGTNTSAVQSVVAVERTVFYREKAAGMYSPLPYAFAQVAIEVIYVAIQTFIYSFILYAMIGFTWNAANFFWFYYYVCMCFVYFTLYGMMLVALTPNYQIAAITMSFFLNFWNLFSGFLISRTVSTSYPLKIGKVKLEFLRRDIPIWWRWYYWGSPVAWTLYGLITSQVGDKTVDVEVPGQGTIPVKQYLKDNFGYEYDFLGYVALAHIGWAVLFCFVFAYAALTGDDLMRSMSRRGSFASGSRKGWGAASIREAFTTTGGDVFEKSGRRNDEEELKWAAIERLPTYDRLRKGFLRQVLDNGNVVHEDLDVANLGLEDKKHLMESILKVVDDDNERFLQRLRDRIDRVGIDIPKIEIRYQNMSIEGDAFVGSRALPTLLNSTINFIEGVLGFLRLFPSKKQVVKILHEVSGIVRPSRMTLLLGPPASGKTTLLKALAGKLDKDVRVTGQITYCGHEMREFVPQRTCAYISQNDLHHGEMTVRETMDYSGRCLGVGTRYEMLAELSRREKDAGIKPDPEIDAFMKAIAMSGQKTTLVTDYVLKTLGLDICSDTMVGDEMRRGISGGQKKRVTTGEMLVGPAKVFLMDEISTGLDSSTTFQIVKYMRQMVHIMDVTMIISLLQPAPETYDLFDDIILLSEGQVVYQGPRENVLEFFEYIGFKCPDRKGVADFLQEVTSKKDQEQYWFKKNKAYQYVSVPEFVHHFNSFHIGQKVSDVLRIPYDKSKAHPAALVTNKYGISNKDLFKACLSREWLLMKRNSFVYIFKTTQITIMAIFTFTVFFRTKMKAGDIDDGGKFYGALFFSLINVMFNGMAELALTIFRLPVFFKQRDSLFYPAWAFALPIWLLRLPLSVMESGIWIILTYYTVGFAPSATRYPNNDTMYPESTAGKELLKARGMFVDDHWYWICVIALFAFSLFFNLCFVAALTFLNPLGDTKSIIAGEDDIENKGKRPFSQTKASIVLHFLFHLCDCGEDDDKRNYEMKSQGVEENRLQLLRNVSGAFRPGVLTALVGVSGAGKTTLMDVLAGRKTGGYIEGNISISGYPKNQETFARVSGYCEQNDIHSPHVTVYESLLYSAWLRLAPDVKQETRQMFVEEVMDLVELNPLKDALVGLPGVDGLSTEQRKRLTIAVELVANPSIIFMDEPTSGLDARAAAIVMRAVRNTVDTGRTVVCTIHQPSIDIFEAFDELFLMKRGGQVTYAGPLGRYSHLLVEYFESLPGVTKIKDGYNPATWMLEVSSTAVEAQHEIDFAEIYANSDLYKRNGKLIKELSTPAPGSQDLYFPTQYSQPLITQFKACFWKQHWSYWRNPQYNAIRFFMTTVIGLIFGIIFWKKGDKMHKQQDLSNLMGAMYAAVLFLGGTNTSAVQSVVAIERTVFYREKAAGMYSALPYAFAQAAVETIYVAIQTFLYSLLLYSMIGFHWQPEKFLWFYYYVFMCFLYFTLYGMMLVALTPSYQIAAIVMSFFLSFWNLFSGFLIPRMQIPIWWRWYYWGSPVAWTIYGLVTSQVGDKMDLVHIPDHGEIPVKAYLKEFLGYESDFLGHVAAAHVGWVVLFFAVFVYGIKVLNFQRR
ncbi:hypothetical protein RJ640_014183, partial [Escallonia rubra]